MVKTNFFEYLDFALQFAPLGPEEQAIRTKLASIGVGAGKKFDFNDLSPEAADAGHRWIAPQGARFDSWMTTTG